MFGARDKMESGMAFAAVNALRLPLPHHLPLLPYPGSTGGVMSVREMSAAR